MIVKFLFSLHALKISLQTHKWTQEWCLQSHSALLQVFPEHQCVCVGGGGARARRTHASCIRPYTHCISKSFPAYIQVFKDFVSG